MIIDNRNRELYVIVIFTFVLLYACGSRREVNEEISHDAMDVLSHEELHNHLYYSDLQDAQTVQLSGNVKLDNWPSASYTIRMQPDSVIWFSIRALGFELSRGIFRRDSVSIMDKFNGEYFQGSYADFERISEVPLSYEIVESLLFGRVLPIGFELADVQWGEGEFRVKGVHADYDCFVIQSLPQYSYGKWLFEPKEKVERLMVSCSDYKSFINDEKFPYIREYMVLEDNQTLAHLQLKTQKIEKNISISMPYRVPPSYDSMF